MEERNAKAELEAEAKVAAFFENALTECYFEDPVQKHAYQLLMSGKFDRPFEPENQSAVDSEAIAGLIMIGLMEGHFSGEIHGQVPLFRFQVHARGAWVDEFHLQLNRLLKMRGLDAEKHFCQFSPTNPAQLSTEGFRAREMSVQGDRYDARWWIRERWGIWVKPVVSIRRFESIDQQDLGGTPVVAAAQAIASPTINVHVTTPAPPESDETMVTEGAGLYDAAMFLSENDRKAAAETLRRWRGDARMMKKIRWIGDDPSDNRQKIAEVGNLAKVVSDKERHTKAERGRLFHYLTEIAREPEDSSEE